MKGVVSSSADVGSLDTGRCSGLIGASGAVWVEYAWDTENRLIEVTPVLPGGTARKTGFGYDCVSARRIAS